MKITILCVGKIKERFFRDAIEEYSKRLSRYVSFEIVEVADEKAPETLSPKEAASVKDKEGERLISRLKDGFVVPLVIEGKELSSTDLADFIKDRSVRGTSHITFVIGGSLGLSDSIIKKGDFKLSFSRMTFPHQLMRVILCEQIYRAYRIINNEPYHK